MKMDTVNVVSEASLSMVTPASEDMSLGVGDNFLTFLDENSSVVFKGVIDPSGAFLIDPSQLVNILLDQSQTQTQNFLDNTSPMTIQMIQMPPHFQANGKSSISDINFSHSGGKLGSVKSFQFQDFATASNNSMNHIESRNCTSNLHDSGLRPTMNSSAATVVEPGLPALTKQSNVTKSADSDPEPRGSKSDLLGRETSFVCNICSEPFAGYQQLRKHKATHFDEKPFRCQKCSMEFNFEMNLKLHTIMHDAEESGNLQCKVCLAKFSRLASLKSHLRTHEKEENLVCNECGEEVPTLAKLNDHMEEHNTRVQQCMLYRCKLCGKTFNSQALLRDHSKGHADVRKELKIFARQKPRSKSKHKLISESSNWSPAKSKQKKKRICSVCSKAFDKPSQLERHFRVHSGAKPFQCSYPDCNKCFNQKVTLESHVLACHQRLKPFKCHMCNICFSQRGNLKSHIVKVHIPSGENDKVFKCEECACVYRRLATLNHHIARVHSVISTTDEFSSNPERMGSNSVTDTPKAKMVEAANTTRNETTIQKQGSSQLEQQPILNVQNDSESTFNSHEIEPSAVTDETIHEVNCVYGDSLGVPKRCLLKVKKVGQKKYHLCPACPKSFRKPSDLIRHIRVHTLERPYVCNICSKSFAVKSTLSTHMKTHDLVKSLSCGVCQKKFSVLSSLKSHERLHTGVKPFQCMQCGKQFRTSTQRRVHQKTHARNALGLTGRRKLLRIGEAKSNVALPDPLKITSGGLVPVPNRIIRTTANGESVDKISRPYRCTYSECASSFKKSSHLKQHMLSHSGERPYKCLQCHRNFISSGVLKNHIKTHEGVRAYSCEKCHFAFTTNGSLKRHMATHMSERLFVCPYCARTFKTSVATRKHIKVHRNETVPPNNTFPDLNFPNKGVLLINQSHQQLSLSENQQFSDTQIYEASELNSIYGTEFSVLANQLDLAAPASSQEQVRLPSDKRTVQELAVPQNGLDISHHESSILQHSTGDNILEYTLLASTINSHENQDPTENLDLRLDQETNFDPSIFTLQLQQGESLDLQFLQDSQGIVNDSTNCLNQIVSYEFESPSSKVLSLPDQRGEILDCIATAQPNAAAQENKDFAVKPTLPVIATSSASKSTVQKRKVSQVCKLESKTSAAPIEDTVEIRNLQEVSRPISEQLYTELATLPYQRRLKGEVGQGSLEESAGNKDCPICNTKFKKKSDLDRHYLIHTGEKPYRCSICGKSFRVKSTRQAHMRTHDEKKKTVACHVCHNLFSTKSSLRVHLRSHLNLKPYPCPFPNCSRQFRTSGHRKSHIQSHFKEAKKRKLEGASSFPKSKGILPSVETLKDKSSTITQQIEQLEQRVQSMMDTPITNGNNTGEVSSENNNQLVGGVRLQFDGVHFASLDMGTLQVDDNFLQNVTIFLPSAPQANGTEIVEGTNMIIGMIPGQELTPAGDILSGKDIMSYNVLGSTTGIQLTANDPLSDNIHQYIIHNNEMMSSTARPSTSIQSSASYVLPSVDQDLVCSSCHTCFSTKAQLDKHEKTHNPVPKPFKCSICSRTFALKGSFEVHFKTHSKEKIQFPCPLCPYITQRKPNLKTHFTRAHPNNWEQFDKAINNGKLKAVKAS